MSTQLVLAGGNSNLFKDVDFSQLNSAITSLGGASTQLTPDEKTNASKLVDEWTNTVTNKLNSKRYDLSSVLSFFDNRGYQCRSSVLSDEQLASLAEQTGTTDTFSKIAAQKEIIEIIQEKKRPADVYHDINLSEVQNMLNQKQYEMDYHIFQAELNKEDNKLNKLMTDWIKELKKHAAVKDMIAKAKEYIRTYNDVYEQAKQKGQLAKLNILISNAETRDALRSLLDFTETI